FLKHLKLASFQKEEAENALKKIRLAYIPSVPIKVATKLSFKEPRANEDMLALENSSRTYVISNLSRVKSAVEVGLQRVLYVLKGLVLSIGDGKDLLAKREASLKKQVIKLEKGLDVE
ncbi:hypothetical protein GIB67_033855, partial [Kingdonia uniflora]